MTERRVRMILDGKVVRRVPPHLRKRTYTRGTPIERAVERIVLEQNGCWSWDGSHVPAGYGHLNVGQGKFQLAHQVVYRHFIGSVPKGYELDHLCRNRGCVNPAHLEPVTHRENVRRGNAAFYGKTGRCGRGHDLTIHGYVRKDGRSMLCRQCQRDRTIKS